jgi:membrane-bound lytic murein transglycosylase D
MLRNDIATILMLLIILSLGSLTISSCSVSKQDVFNNRSGLDGREKARAEESPVTQDPGATALQNPKIDPETNPNPQADPPARDEKKGLHPEQLNTALNSTDIPRKKDEIVKHTAAVESREPIISSDLSKPSETIIHKPLNNSSILNPRNERKAVEEETERDVMEEALVLLDGSQKYWVNGELEDALQMLDQAYALLLDTNGNPDIMRQKDDLRLMISKRILAIYNSHQSVAKGKRGEIPIVTNPDVEKEIRLFQTVERDFFIGSYQRSMIYRPLIVRELKKAGLPEELSWLPLVESGYKINALSSARALGLWQFIPSTGYKYGLNRDDWVDERMDVEKSTRAAIDYFKDLHAMFGDWLTVLAGYNCGEGRVMRTIASQHINYLDRFWDLYQRLPNETARYVPRFVATLLIVRDPQKYGIDLGPETAKTDILSYEVAEINRCLRLQDIAQALETSEETINILNAELRHRMTPDRPYKLKVPIEKAELLLKMAADIPSGEKPRDSFKTVRGVFIKHRVRQGETLASIAGKYKTTAEAIRSANRLSKKRLVEGQRLNIPIRSSVASGSAEKATGSGKSMHHIVQKGDTISALSRKYGISVTEIRKSNGLKNDTLKIGQTLQLATKNEEETTANARKQAKPPRNKERVKTETKPVQGKASESTAPKQYKAKKGDSLQRIAQENNITLDRLLKLNRMGQKEIIHPGQVILLQ